MLKKLVIAGVIASVSFGLLGFVVLRNYYYDYYYVLTPVGRTSDPDLLVYQVNEDLRLVYGRNVALLINTRQRVVSSPGAPGQTCGSRAQIVMSIPFSISRKCENLLLWPRDWLKGVLLDMGLKEILRILIISDRMEWMLCTVAMF
jgi:hypothetical protein